MARLEIVRGLSPIENPVEPPVESGSADSRSRTDVALARLLRDDPQAAAAAIYDRFARQVNRWVWRLLGADPDHNDVVQQVFVRVIRSAPRLRDTDRLVPWVHAITVNTVYGELRRREVRRIFTRTSEAPRLHADFVREVEVRDLLLRAKAVFELLPAKERMVFVLYYVEERTTAEIAEVLGFSQSTAKRRLKRATHRFEALVARLPDLAEALPRLKVGETE